MTRTHRVVLNGILKPDQTMTYPLLPFEVPPHTGRIEVSYRYAGAIGSDPQLTGGNTVDIGIFDSRGASFMAEGFRGWSGSARSEFFISTTEATPGYMPGPLPAGTWNICLGAYKVADTGCAVEVTIEITESDGQEEAGFPQRLPLSNVPRHDVQRADGWYKGELHCHTVHSDGDSSPADVVRRAGALGLDYLAIMDHNVQSQQVALATVETPLMLIPGTEVTTYRGHWNTWGAGPWIDFRVLIEADMQAAVDRALAAGYLISCNHPKPFGPEWVYPKVTGFHCIEVWNGPWPAANDISLAYWDSRLRAGARIAAVGGSDCHFHKIEHPAKLGNPTTFIHCEGAPSPAALLGHLRAGHAFISEAPDGPELVLSAGGVLMGDSIRPEGASAAFTIHTRRAQGKTLQIVTAEGVVYQSTVTQPEWQRTIEVRVVQTSYVRCMLVSGSPEDLTVHAVSNPVYIESASHQN
ncbi:MAG: CehA/McbA family metallohydrolase [Anaerolineae bacterium]|nr:CehA/McbA family metallohydrolase [Anaerolineae bacterium]